MSQHYDADNLQDQAEEKQKQRVNIEAKVCSKSGAIQ
jgi:hypothetical protein